MDLEKLNLCLSEMDTLSKIVFDYDRVEVEIRFNCYSGGQYEDVDLVLTLEDPYYYHLPFTLEGQFQIAECSPGEVKKLVPNNCYESELKALDIKITGESSGFYSCFSNITWSVSGGGSIKNAHELLSVKDT